MVILNLKLSTLNLHHTPQTRIHIHLRNFLLFQPVFPKSLNIGKDHFLLWSGGSGFRIACAAYSVVLESFKSCPAHHDALGLRRVPS